MRDRTFVNATGGEFSDVFDTHLYGAINVLQPAFAWMKEHESGGRIVLTTSTSAF
jgi:NAD(P)-dependent dehydrogenase (short-subunit alcohol dehydrogenase family)